MSAIHRIAPTLAEVQQHFQAGDLVPIYRSLPADLETPVSVFLKLFDPTEPAFLLESVEGGEQVSRYSFIGVQPSRVIRTLPDDPSDPLDKIQQALEAFQPVALPGLPRFVGGAVGYFSYDLVRRIERLPNNTEDDLQLPEAMFMLFDSVIIFDHAKAHLIILANAHNTGDPAAAYQAAVDRIESLVAKIRQPLSPPSNGSGRVEEELRSTFTQAEYEAVVERAKEYIRAGDAFQIVPSQRLSRRTSASAVEIYRALRMLNPSPYMFMLHYPDATADGQPLSIVGASPEMLVRLEDGVASVRPIAGTRKRGQSLEEDKALEQDLLQDPKELAEHIMLVDLGRNDLGRVCEYGSVQVPELKVIERYSHVMHIVSHVEGKLREGYTAYDLLRATFPAGTVSGAPKIRAMQIIDELEKTRRHIYAGGVGYFSFDGSMDTCISIRTLVKIGDQVYVQAGGGVVADSDPSAEYHETLNKARAVAEAIRLAEEGF